MLIYAKFIIQIDIQTELMHYTKQNKPDSKDYMLYNLHDILEKPKLQGNKTDQWLPEGRNRKSG